MRHIKKGNRRGILALLLPLTLALFGGCGHEEDVQGQRQENATEQPETQNGEPTAVITIPYSRQDGTPSDQAIDHIDFTISCVDAPDLGQCPSSYRVEPNEDGSFDSVLIELAPGYYEVYAEAITEAGSVLTARSPFEIVSGFITQVFLGFSEEGHVNPVNFPPKIESVILLYGYSEGGVTFVGMWLGLNAEASDQDGDELRYLWTSSVIEPGNLNQFLLFSTPQEATTDALTPEIPAKGIVTIAVSDGKPSGLSIVQYALKVQDWGQAEITFFVNWQPRIEGVYVTDAQLDHNDRTLLTPIITDSNGDRYEVKWEVPEECGSVDDANAEQVIYTAPAQGEMTCELMLTVTEIRFDEMEPLSSSMPVYIHIGEPVSPF